MAKKPETLFEAKVVSALESLQGGFFFKLMAGSIRGLPDRVGCYKSRFIALEIKVEKNKASALQKWTLGKLARAGAFTAVVTPENWDKIFGQIKNL